MTLLSVFFRSNVSCSLLDRIDEVEPRVALIWMLGEFGNEITEAPYLLEPIIDRYDEESPQIKLELLSSTMKLFFQVS